MNDAAHEHDTWLTGIRSDEVQAIWPKVLPIFERALKHDGGRRQAEDILEALLDTRQQLWVATGREGAIELVLVTEIAIYPRMKVCRLMLTAADRMDLCLRHLPVIESWARTLGCKRVEAIGQADWTETFPGYRPAWVTVERDLTHG